MPKKNGFTLESVILTKCIYTYYPAIITTHLSSNNVLPNASLHLPLLTAVKQKLFFFILDRDLVVRRVLHPLSYVHWAL